MRVCSILRFLGLFISDPSSLMLFSDWTWWLRWCPANVGFEKHWKTAYDPSVFPVILGKSNPHFAFSGSRFDSDFMLIALFFSSPNVVISEDHITRWLLDSWKHGEKSTPREPWPSFSWNQTTTPFGIYGNLPFWWFNSWFTQWTWWFSIVDSWFTH